MSSINGSLPNREEMNMMLYQACVNLYQAGKNLSYFDPKLGLKLYNMADKIASIIEAPNRKITDEEMDDILNNILNSDN